MRNCMKSRDQMIYNMINHECLSEMERIWTRDTSVSALFSPSPNPLTTTTTIKQIRSLKCHYKLHMQPKTPHVSPTPLTKMREREGSKVTPLLDDDTPAADTCRALPQPTPFRCKRQNVSTFSVPDAAPPRSPTVTDNNNHSSRSHSRTPRVPPSPTNGGSISLA